MITKQEISQYEKIVMHLADKIYRDYSGNYSSVLSKDDLVQSGMIGLIDAWDKFDDSQGAKFETYAYWRIKGSMLDQIRQLDFVPRTTRVESNKHQKTKNKLTQELSRVPNRSEMANAMNIDEKRVEKLEAACELGNLLISLDHGYSKDGEIISGYDIIGEGEFEEFVNKRDNYRLLNHIFKLIKSLPLEERVIIMRYFFGGTSLKDIGDEMGKSTSRIWQIKEKGLKKLRKGVSRFLTEQSLEQMM